MIPVCSNPSPEHRTRIALFPGEKFRTTSMTSTSNRSIFPPCITVNPYPFIPG